METVYVYLEGNDDNPEGENAKEVFADRKSAEAYLRKRVLDHYGCTWDELPEKILDESGCESLDDITVESDEISDGFTAFWIVYERRVRCLPKNGHGTRDIGEYTVIANGLTYDDEKNPLLNIQVFKFDGNKPLNDGKPVRSFYASWGDIDWIPDEVFIDMLITKYGDNAIVDLCEESDMWDDWKKDIYLARRKSKEAV